MNTQRAEALVESFGKTIGMYGEVYAAIFGDYRTRLANKEALLKTIDRLQEAEEQFGSQRYESFRKRIESMIQKADVHIQEDLEGLEMVSKKIEKCEKLIQRIKSEGEVK